MTTTAFDDQFTPATQTIEPVRQPYDTVSILKRNVADLEVALKQQTERAEAAEGELEAVREDNHSMMTEINELRAELANLAQQKPVAWRHENGNIFLPWQKDLITTNAVFSPLYAAPAHVPAPAVPAPSVPEEWREFVKRTAEVGLHATNSGVECTCYRCVAIRGARALLQSSVPAPAVPAEIIELSKKYAIDTEAYHAAMDALLQSAEVRHD